MIKISRESEINLINILIDQDVISGKDLIDIKKKSSDGDKSQIDAVFELNLTDEDKILDLLVKEEINIVNSSSNFFLSSTFTEVEKLIYGILMQPNNLFWNYSENKLF